MEGDARGRNTKLTDPAGNITYTVYKDASHEIRTYRGWNSTTHTNTGPIEVMREYRPAANASSGQQTLYFESLTSSVAPGLNGSNLPDGSETLTSANIQSLVRSLTNSTGQVSQVDAYFSLSGVTYSQANVLLGSASNDSSSGNRHATLYGYNAAGRLAVITEPTGTIRRTVFDGRGSGTTTTLVDSPLSSTSGSYVGYTLRISGGTGAGQTATVTAYNGSTKTLTLAPTLTTAPDNTSTYVLVATPLVSSFAYDVAGNLQDVTDPRGNVNRRAYDLLSRTISTTEAYVDGTLESDVHQRTSAARPRC